MSRAIVFFILTLLTPLPVFTAAESCSQIDYFQVKFDAWVQDDFPIEAHVWDAFGWLIHYNWGFSVYIYLKQNNFYFRIDGGSVMYSVYFSTDPLGVDGYEVNGMFANYLLSSSGSYAHESHGGLFKWNSTARKWSPVVLATESTQTSWAHINHSPGGEVKFCANQGKLALSELGNPERVWIVFEALELYALKAPQKSFVYLDVANKLAVAFVVQKRISVAEHPGTAYPYEEPKSWVISRTERANATFVLKNYGEHSILGLSAEVSVPPEVCILGGNSVWGGDLGPHQEAVETLMINRTVFGTSELELIFTYMGSEEIGPVRLCQKLTMVPSVDIVFEAPENVLLMQSYATNVTVTNLDPLVASVTLSPFALGRGDIISVTLDPYKKVLIHPRVTIVGTSLGYAVEFQGIVLNRSVQRVELREPEISIIGVWVDSVRLLGLESVSMEVRDVYLINVTVSNAESVPYEVDMSLNVGSLWHGANVADSGLFLANFSSQTLQLPPHSNTTVVIRVMPLNVSENSLYENLYVLVDVGGFTLDWREIRVKIVLPPPWYAPLLSVTAMLIYAGVFTFGVFLGVLYHRLRRYGRKVPEQRWQNR